MIGAASCVLYLLCEYWKSEWQKNVRDITREVVEALIQAEAV